MAGQGWLTIRWFVDDSAMQFHKGFKIKSYTMAFKLQAIKKAEESSNSHAAKVDRKRIREWRKKKEQILEVSRQIKAKERKGLDGTGRKPLCEEMDERVLEWITERRSKNLRVSRIMIMKKAKIIYDELEIPEKSANFKATHGWMDRFMRRNGLSLRRRTSTVQKYPD